MQNENLANLKLKIETLLQSHQQLQNENHALRNRLAKLIQQRATLLNAKDKISKKIKALINQIRKESL